jgi:hypothetical protein
LVWAAATATTASTVTSSVGGDAACSHVTNTTAFSSAINGYAEIWKCAGIVAATNAVMTVSWGASNAGYPTLYVTEARGAATTPDSGIGNHANSTTTGTTASVATNGNVPQVGELLYSIAFMDAGTLSPGAGQTAINVTPPSQLDQYGLTTVAGAPVTVTTTSTAAANWMISVAGFAHP